MQRSRKIVRKTYQRRAVIAVQVAVMSTVILGMGALAIDLGAMYTTQTELQVAADAAALAAAALLGGGEAGEPEALAYAAADTFAKRHPAWGEYLDLTPQDVVFGRSNYNAETEKFDFTPGGTNFDAVRVTVRRTEGSPNGAMPLLFANIFGVATADLQASAAATLIPRDIAVVIDISNSMCYDSQLRFWNRSDGGCSNLRDIWCALNGPQPNRPYFPGPEGSTQYAGDTGPTFGEMKIWGNALTPGVYNATTDPGLWLIKKNQDCTVTAARNALVAKGYNTNEVNALLSKAKDGTTNNWRNRTAVIIGAAIWHSGKSGGYAPSGGDGDNVIENGETQWLAAPSFARDWNWQTYVDWVDDNNVYVSGLAGTAFQYRYGLKTLTDFMMDQQPENFSTSNLWSVPEEPLRAVKDAVQSMVDVIASLDNLDHVSLEVFATTARHQLNLTDELQTIPNTLYGLQSGHWDRTTNIGGGLSKAYSELTSARARGSTRKIIVLMSDGQPNVDEEGNYTYDGSPGAVGYALDMAQLAADHDFRIYTVSVGYDADRQLMQEIATIGHGQEFAAQGNPEDYTQQLEVIFRTLGGERPVALIE